MSQRVKLPSNVILQHYIALVAILWKKLEMDFVTTRKFVKFLEEYIDSEGGPLIHHDDDLWQNELDTACRKLYKYLLANC